MPTATATDVRTGTTYQWDVRRQRYVGEDGRDLGDNGHGDKHDETLTLLVLLLLLDAERDLLRTTAPMLRGEVTIGEWQDEFALRLRTLHLLVWLLAVGGVNAATAADYDAAAAAIETQLVYLGRFARQIEQRHPSANSDTDVVRRVRLYARAANGTYEAARRESHRRMNDEFPTAVTLERRILADAEHCPTCVVEAGKGWQPLGTLRRIGDSECRMMCRCRWQFKTVLRFGERRTAAAI
jgi:hypothetical protein